MNITSVEKLRQLAQKAKGGEVGPFLVKLDEIRRDPAFQIRVDVDVTHVKKLAGAFKAGAELPPISLAFCGDEKEPVVIDGHHRCRALLLNRTPAVLAMAAALPRPEALWRAARANDTHGLPLKPRERREMFRAYVRTRQHVVKGSYGKDGQAVAGQLKSYDDIARELGIAKSTVWRWMRADFRKTAAKMGPVGEFTGEGGLRPAPQEPEKELDAARSALVKLRQAFGDAPDYWVREEILKLGDSMLATLQQQHEVEDETSMHWEDAPVTPEDESIF